MSLLINEPFVLQNSKYLTVEPFRLIDDRLIAGFSTRQNGYSMKSYNSLNMGLHVDDDDANVIRNRESLAKDLNISLNNWIFTEQIHDAHITEVTKSDCGRGTRELDSTIPGADGLYTKDKNILLASLYADCVPLYFWSPSHNIVGLAHAGWKGTVAQIGTNMVHLWTSVEKVPIDSIYVAIGPSISQESYEVNEYVINKVKDIIVDSRNLPYVEIGRNKFLLNLKELNKQLLLRIGIKKEQIFISNYCTFKENQLFYSYRRENKTGRMMSFIARR